MYKDLEYLMFLFILSGERINGKLNNLVLIYWKSNL